MQKERYLQLIDKASNYIVRLNGKEYTPDNKAALALLYQIDTMIYSLSGIDTATWQSILKTFKEAKNMLRTHSKDETIKKVNYLEAATMIHTTLEKYIAFLQTSLRSEEFALTT
jgi:hypothetical protein